MIDRGGPMPFQPRNWPTFFLALLSCSTAVAQTPAALRDVTEVLRAEAQQVRQSNEVPERADFASRSDEELPEELIAQALTRPMDQDPFVDAYIRWQLTSFRPQPRWSQRDFLRLLSQLPAMVPNPRGDEQVHALLERAVELGPLNRSDRRQLQQFSRELDEQTERAETLNRPALELRTWIRDTVEDDDMRRIQALMEQCAATIDAAWSTQGVKMRISFAMSAGAESDTLTNAQRRAIAEQLQRLVGRHRRFVNQITFLANSTVNVTYSNARVTQRDVDNWLERLAGLHE